MPKGHFVTNVAITCYKKAYADIDSDNDVDVIIKLLIPKGTKIYCLDPKDKHRAASAKVIEITAFKSAEDFGYSPGGRRERFKSAYSKHDDTFVYTVGKKVKPKYGFSMREDECESGIHFFRTRRGAENW